MNTNHDIEPALERNVSPLEDSLIQRVIVFTVSGSCIVDLKSDSQQHHLSYRIKAEKLTGFLCHLVLQRRKKIEDS